MSMKSLVHCPRCREDVQTVPIKREAHNCETYVRACPTCTTRFTWDGLTFPVVAHLPAPTFLAA